MLISKEVEVKLHRINIQYYKNLGYNIPTHKDKQGRIAIQRGTKIIVAVEHLPKGAHAKVEVLCDYCQENTSEKVYKDYVRSKENNEKDCCNECKLLKTEETMLEKYNVPRALMIPEIAERITKQSYTDFEIIQNTFRLKNLLLLSTKEDYTGCHGLLKYICNIHPALNIQEDSYYTVLYGAGCSLCGYEHREATRLRGKDHPNYNHDLTDEDRLLTKKTLEYANWRLEVYKRDNYKCTICNGKTNSINAHHLKNWYDNPDLRFNIDNGITLCFNHHSLFHSIFGRRNNTPEQFEQFKYFIKSGDINCLEVDQEKIKQLMSNPMLINKI
jgi:5-methylcytosine-specific restriction endonuclease McrA